VQLEQAPGAPDGRGTPAPVVRTADDVGGRGPLVCAACDRPITDDDHRVERGGAHRHTFVNPGGFAYEISCFGVATGCSYRGTPEHAFSWFPGFSWQLAACGHCGAHLGWLFRAPDETFHGFIDGRLKPAR
jgi:hypothetical protein